MMLLRSWKSTLNITAEVISEVADVLRAAKSMGIRFGCLDQVIGRSTRRGNIATSYKISNTLKSEAEKVRKQLNSIENLIK